MRFVYLLHRQRQFDETKSCLDAIEKYRQSFVTLTVYIQCYTETLSTVIHSLHSIRYLGARCNSSNRIAKVGYCHVICRLSSIIINSLSVCLPSSVMRVHWDKLLRLGLPSFR